MFPFPRDIFVLPYQYVQTFLFFINNLIITNLTLNKNSEFARKCLDIDKYY